MLCVCNPPLYLLLLSWAGGGRKNFSAIFSIAQMRELYFSVFLSDCGFGSCNYQYYVPVMNQ